jgi:transcriptional regulator with XRE-family HTH domain
MLVREHRIAAKLTQERLAERAGLGRRSIQRLEESIGLPQKETFRRLSDALRLTVEQKARFGGASFAPGSAPEGNRAFRQS